MPRTSQAAEMIDRTLCRSPFVRVEPVGVWLVKVSPHALQLLFDEAPVTVEYRDKANVRTVLEDAYSSDYRTVLLGEPVEAVELIY